LENTGCYKSKRRPKLRFEVGQRVICGRLER
jgi:hypothetical protein